MVKGAQKQSGGRLPVRPDALNDSGRREKVIGLTPESVIGLNRNR